MLHDLTKLKIIKDKTLGYEVVYYPKHPFARKGSGVVYLHRIIMENHLGRYLKQDEHVQAEKSSGLTHPANRPYRLAG